MVINFFAGILDELKHMWNCPFDRAGNRAIIILLVFAILLLSLGVIVTIIATHGMLLVFLFCIAGVVTLFYHFLDLILGRKTEKDD